MQKRTTFRAFSLIEILVGLIIISLALGCFAPIINKKVRAQSTAMDSKLTENCSKWPNCNLCKGTQYCIQCSVECDVDHKLRTEDCKCIN